MDDKKKVRQLISSSSLEFEETEIQCMLVILSSNSSLIDLGHLDVLVSAHWKNK